MIQVIRRKAEGRGEQKQREHGEKKREEEGKKVFLPFNSLPPPTSQLPRSLLLRHIIQALLHLLLERVDERGGRLRELGLLRGACVCLIDFFKFLIFLGGGLRERFSFFSFFLSSIRIKDRLENKKEEHVLFLASSWAIALERTAKRWNVGLFFCCWSFLLW